MPLDEVAAVTQRIAVLLSAGVSPASAWTYLLPEASPEQSAPEQSWPPLQSLGERMPLAGPAPESGQVTADIIRAAVEAASRGQSVADAVAGGARSIGGQVGDAWLGLAAAWAVATAAGAPLATCLRDLAASFRELGQLNRDLQVALAGPRATARLVMGLPVGGIAVGALMGFNALHVLFFTVPGWLCLLGAGGLMHVAARWNRRLVRAATRAEATPGLELDLMAIAMAGGASVDRARSLVQETSERFGIRSRAGTHEPRGDDPMGRVLRLSQRAGVPAAELLRSEASQARRDARSAGQRRSEALAVTLMLPLGVCVLPAFMLVGVVPLVLSILSTTLGSF
ncbi:type II secretion system F family protein [Cryobacterium psychrophilum]|uniref:type II secretion system F family protein n=1 Tax=Cryobacterium psychrophilum TaxID=41988 RepID=UPI0010ECA799|nr:type II secretion system F family protein [Cryobacterium psychrophilum]TDW30593.1 tight adherence protein B [Cryobacterium psychrophilum]